MSLLSSRCTRFPTLVIKRSPIYSRTNGRFTSQASRSVWTTSGSAEPSPLIRGLLAGIGFSFGAGLLAYSAGLIGIPDSSLSASSKSQYGSHEDVQKAISELRDAFPDKKSVSTDPDVVKQYGSSPNSYHPASPHSVVVHVHSTEDVVKVVNIARKYRVPVVAYSGATSLEGHFSGVGPIIRSSCNILSCCCTSQISAGSICIDMSAMDQILRIDGES